MAMERKILKGIFYVIECLFGLFCIRCLYEIIWLRSTDAILALLIFAALELITELIEKAVVGKDNDHDSELYDVKEEDTDNDHTDK